MLTLVQIQSSATSASDSALLVADYLAFDKRRTSRRQYQKAFGGMAIIVMVGALLGQVAIHEAEIVSAGLLLPVVALAVLEAISRSRLMRRLNRVRRELQSGRQS